MHSDDISENTSSQDFATQSIGAETDETVTEKNAPKGPLKILIKLGPKVKPKKTEGIVSVSEEPVTTSGIFAGHQCHLCYKFYSSKWSLKKHAQIHTGEKPFRCDFCPSSFTCSSSLKNHIMSHSDLKPYRCELCPRTFRSKFELKQHILLHSGERPYECSICNKRFKRSCYLMSHLRVHTGEKPYECEVCKKSFADRRTLERHNTVHTGMKPFSCDYCHKTFTQRGHCRTHMKMHLGVNLFTCEVCGRAYPFKCYLNRHMRVHTGDKPYECTYCQKKFARYAHLQLHLPVHTDEKNFECQICHAKFARPYSLKIHVQKHSGIRVKCELCEATFTHRVNLNKHQRQVHKIYRGPPGSTSMLMPAVQVSSNDENREGLQENSVGETEILDYDVRKLESDGKESVSDEIQDYRTSNELSCDDEVQETLFNSFAEELLIESEVSSRHFGIEKEHFDKRVAEEFSCESDSHSDEDTVIDHKIMSSSSHISQVVES